MRIADAKAFIAKYFQQYPGIRQRLYEEDRLRANLTVVVDGVVSSQRLRQRLNPSSEVHFLPVISGGGE